MMRSTTWNGGLAMLCALTLVGCASTPAGDLSGDDTEQIRASSRAYLEAWLSNDPEAVMATFVAEPVLSPSGLPFMEGQAAARSFWWPEGSPPATVTRFEADDLEVGGSGSLGYVRGHFTLVFEWGGETFTNRGKYLHLVQRAPGDGWRISHHFWNDLPLEEESEPMAEPAHVHHAIDYIEITVTDMGAAQRFYTEALGWSFTDYGPGYAGIQSQELGREQGGLRLDTEVTRGGPLVVLFSRDLDKTLEAVRRAGGRIVTEPFDFPGGRRFHFTDPSGNELAVWAAP